jgi:starch phosphorylase
MESLASLDIPAYGYGIRYKNGMFRQRIDDGWQVELPETWLSHGNPWEFDRRESSYRIGFGGEGRRWRGRGVETGRTDRSLCHRYAGGGAQGKRVNTLRL